MRPSIPSTHQIATDCQETLRRGFKVADADRAAMRHSKVIEMRSHQTISKAVVKGSDASLRRLLFVMGNATAGVPSEDRAGWQRAMRVVEAFHASYLDDDAPGGPMVA